ncbi:hypothetical protein KV557_24685 [Kitasatospora aureofaciens]|uniref:hypothetical protein n=1 Tax=Kitasatospora aureofaciens TaxID=1894 RepID=UPI001C44B59C|nr:hypothetical protein [Kitasatospora aureofaciens]MBV6700262.1 hypothetical protein [Kitasatospora aureofaciens]
MADQTGSSLPDRVVTGAVVHHGATGVGLGGDLEHLAPAAAAALRLLADAIRKGADHCDVVEAIKSAGIAEAFADVFDAAADKELGSLPDDDPFDFDIRLAADNLSAAASDIRRAISPWI